jgi:hypothetical protein
MARDVEIRRAIAAQLEANVGELQVSPYLLSQWQPPTAQLFPASTEFDLAMQRGADERTYTLQVFVAFVTDEGAQVILDEYLERDGERSVKRVVELDENLGGLVDSVRVTRHEGYRQFASEGQPMVLGTEFTIVVLAPGKDGG